MIGPPFRSPMPETWILITIAAAFFQNIRSALQKHLKRRLSVGGASYARFLYALPIAGIYLSLLFASGDHPLPVSNTKFLLFCLLGGVCQILFTACLLWMFSFKSFAVGTTFSKLEVIVVALLGAVLLGDLLSRSAIAAIVISSFGVMLLSVGQNKLTLSGLRSGLFRRPTLIGLITAVFLGGSSVFYRGASLALQYDNFVISAAWTLFVALVIQTVLMGGYLVLRQPGEFVRVLREWRWAGAAGAAGAFASICWFSAFTIQNAGYVRALGQIELLFTFVATTIFFRERVSAPELFGILLICGGILLLLLGG